MNRNLISPSSEINFYLIICSIASITTKPGIGLFFIKFSYHGSMQPKKETSGIYISI